jgi:hypothetical protein
MVANRFVRAGGPFVTQYKSERQISPIDFFYSVGFSNILATRCPSKEAALKVAPPAERTIPNKRENPPKHKKALRDLLSEV